MNDRNDENMADKNMDNGKTTDNGANMADKNMADKNMTAVDDNGGEADNDNKNDAEKAFPKFDIVFDDAIETVTIGGDVVDRPDDGADNDDADSGDDGVQTDDGDDDGKQADDDGHPSDGVKTSADGHTDADSHTDAEDKAENGTNDDGNANVNVSEDADVKPVEAEHAAAHIDREIDTDDAFKFRSYPTLALKHASYAPDGKGGDVLHDVDMEFHARRFYSVWAQSEAERVAVVGLLSGLMAPTAGKVMFKSQELRELTPLEYRGHFMGLIPQRYALREDLSAVQNLVMTMDASGRNFLKAKPILAAEQLEAVGFPDEKNDRPVRDLLEVERRKAAIARALVCEAGVIIADDPTGRLGEDASREIMTLLRNLTRRDDHCVILVTEDKATAESADIMYRI
ncbi:ATP-binding cassette domain-containing protein [Bifidobacterium catulorum]|uniref:ABC transporter domain-containing protein n=1 Tax=Bifidobacterium catulorum TaxID=1630173 RepID=A0A2U2MT58_9BIFI|nr:ATP-binding cassette domain-containing protein [Bifidobacterium catulorum]PWG60047.1 hypothetical protein DF200_04605 [Bifidobacterium catulorum]